MDVVEESVDSLTEFFSNFAVENRLLSRTQASVAIEDIILKRQLHFQESAPYTREITENSIVFALNVMHTQKGIIYVFDNIYIVNH